MKVFSIQFKKWAKVIFLFLAFSGWFLPMTVSPVEGVVANEASALEWQWPAVPGVGTLEQNSDEAIISRCQQATPDGDQEKIAKCVQQEKNEQLGYLLKYFLYLFFFIAGGVILILIIIAGISYIDASGNVDKLVRSKEQLKRVLLGFVILISSWALLYLINPNLLIFKAKVPTIPPDAGISNEPIQATATMLTFSPKEAIDDTLDKMMKKDAVSGVLNVIKPFDDSAFLVKQALALLGGGPRYVSAQPGLAVPLPGAPKEPRPGLQELLQGCKCGKSKSHIERIGGLNFVVEGGIDPSDVAAKFKGITEKEGREIDARDICLTRCDDCGTNTTTAYDCMLYDVFVKPNDGDPTKKEVWIEVPPAGNDGNEMLAIISADGKWQEERGDPGSPRDKTLEYYQAYSIKYKIAHLQYLIPQLEAMQLKFSGEEIGKLGSVLASNAMSYLLAESQGGIFQPEFEEAKNELAAKGVAVETEEYVMSEDDFAGVERPVSNPINPPAALKPLLKNKFFAALFRFAAPFQNFQNVLAADPAPVKTEPADDRFYIVTNLENTGLKILPYDEGMIEHNKLVVREASRANLYAVLADQSLEEVEKMTGDCMSSAFGEAKYDLPANIEETIRSAVGQGTADYLIYELAKNNSKYADLIGQEIIDNLNKKADGTLQKRCAEKSCGYILPVACVDEKCAEDHLKSFLSDADKKKCVDDCVKANIPANFVSSKLGEFLTGDLIQLLPDEIEKDLSSRLRDTGILSTTTNFALDTKMGVLYDKVLHGALSKSFAEQIPDLKKLLKTSIYDYLAKRKGEDFMQKIDGYLNFSISEYLQKRINKEAEKVATGLGNEFEKLIGGGFDYLKKTMPNLFPESITDPYQCNTTELLLQGYLWQGTEGCKKLTPEAITKMSVDPNSSDGGYAMHEGSRLAIDGDEQTVEMLCHKAGYVWSEYTEHNYNRTNQGWQGSEKSEGWKCGEDQDISTDLEGLTDVRALGKRFLGGAINFIEEFSVALTETILHTVMAYANVWIEDEVLAPMERYITQFSGFQANLKNFMHSSVNNLLPAQISQTLNSNVDTVLKKVCAIADEEPTDEAERDAIKGQQPKKMTEGEGIDISLYGEKTWGGKIPVSGVTNEQIWAVCDASRHLNTTLAKEISSSGKIGAEIIRILNEKVFNLIPWEGVKKYLAMSPSEIIFEETGVKDIEKVVNGTPIDVLCGRIIGVDDAGSFGFVGPNGRKSLAEKCEAVKISRPITYTYKDKNDNDVRIELGITFPDVDQSKITDKSNQDMYRFYCPFVWGACQMPGGGSLPLVGKSVGEIVKGLLVMKCGMTDKDAKMKNPLDESLGSQCQGACLGQSSGLAAQKLQHDPNCPSDIKNDCDLCNVLISDSAAYSLMSLAIENDLGPVSARTPRLRQNEIDAYCWFSVYFKLWKDNGAIESVAKSRGIDANEITDCDSRANVLLNNVNEMDNSDWLKTVILWRMGSGGKTVKDILTFIPDGVVKPAKQGDATLLHPAGQGEATNMLNKTPSQLFDLLIGGAAKGVCAKIISGYEKKYKEYTFSAIWQQLEKQHKTGLAYSMESLDRPNIAEALSRLVDSPVDDEDKIPYLICQYLKSTPAQIFGLDQPLMRYVRPKEYQILFQLINDELEPKDRPEFLNSLLNYLSTYTPVKALASAAPIAQNLSVNPALYNTRLWDTGLSITQTINESAGTLDALAKFFGTTLGAQLLAVFKGDPAAPQETEKPIIDQLCDNLKDGSGNFLLKDICKKKVGISSAEWEKIQNLLLKSPIDLLAAALPWKVPTPANFEKRACRKPSPITNRPEVKRKLIGGMIKDGCAAGETLTPIRGQNLCCKNINSLMDAVGFFWPFLGDPYVDSLFNAAGWTDDVYGALEVVDKTNDGINKAVVRYEAAVAGAVDKAVYTVLDEAGAIAKFVGGKVAGMVGWDIGNNLGEDMAGKCWEIIPDNPGTACDPAKNQIKRERDGKQECCDMGGAFVCTNKCRNKGLASACKEKEGEKLKEEGGDVCCYENLGAISNECYKCRELKSDEAAGGGQCKREGEVKITRQNDAGNQTLNLCCKKREAQETLGGVGVPEGNEQDAAGANKICCETITECVTAKFLNHLEVIQDYLIDGLPINVNSLLPKNQQKKQ